MNDTINKNETELDANQFARKVAKIICPIWMYEMHTNAITFAADCFIDGYKNVDEIVAEIQKMNKSGRLCLWDKRHRISILISREDIVLRIPGECMRIIELPSIGEIFRLIENIGFPLYGENGNEYNKVSLKNELLKKYRVMDGI